MRSGLVASLLLTLVAAGQETAPLRVAIRAGPKTHGEGQHDHPRFLQDWSKLLRERGCEVVTSIDFPDEEELAASDVLVLYAAEGASIHGAERERLERFLARGSPGTGLVVLHDAVCGDDPQWFQTVAGGAWEHGRSRYLEGEIGLVFADREHPITRGVANFDFQDEIYWDLHLDPRAHVLANAFHTPFDVTPQMWVLEAGSHRAFVSLQGHEHASFSHPAWRTLLLRGIAWAGWREADLLTTADERELLRYPPGGPLAPEAAAASFQLHPDFEIGLVASEPLVVNPISLDWDARGRMWVALTPGYPEKQESSGLPARDAIVILEDGDGDGRLEGRRVFAEGLDLVTSLVFHEDGVIVAQSPEILLLRDTDGDDRADVREVLYRGFGHRDTHAVISNLRWGLDGWIYGTQGYSGNDSRNVSGKDGVDHGWVGNGIFRFRPDGSAIEQVVSYRDNTWGLDFHWDGELFFTMANGSHLRHLVLPDRALAAGRMGRVESWLNVTDHDRVLPVRAHERAPYQQIDFVGGFTGAAGSCLYAGGAWPAEFDGDHFVCEPTVNLVHHDSLAPRRVTFHASKEREAEFLASSDLWFRPVHLRVGPDGALYLLDFYNQAAVHNDTRGPPHGPTNAALRPDRDHDHGRIWRIQHRRARPLSSPVLAGATARALAEALEHENAWARSCAQRLLCQRPLEPATSEFLADRASHATRPETRVLALWTLARRDPHRLARILDSCLRDPQPGVRKNALRALETLGSWDLARFGPRAEELLRDPDPRVALEALVALRSVLREDALAELLGRFPSFEDDWQRSAVLGVAAEDPARFLEACFACDRPESLAVLAESVGRESVRRRALEEAVELVLVAGEHGEEASELAERVLRELVALDRELVPWPSHDLESALARLLSSSHSALAITALPLAERWGRGEPVRRAEAALGERLGSIATDAGEALELRVRALETLLSIPARRAQGLELAPVFLDPFHPPEIQTRVIDALAALEDPGAARILCQGFERLSQAARDRVFAALVQRPESTALLLDAVESGEIRATELGPQRLHRLRRHPVPALAERANGLFERLGSAERADKEALLAELLPLVDQPGDPAHGRALFEQNCGNCHTVAGLATRGGVGPDLTGLGTRGARELLPYLIDPNRSVEPGYLEYVVDTLDGRHVDGVIVRESEGSILLRNSSGEVEVPRAEVAGLRSTGRSPMPAGFESLGAAGLRDLLAFLAGDWSGFRVLDLRYVCTASATRGLYDTRRDARPMRFRRHGIVDVGGVPFELLDPARMDEERNALVLRGGMQEDWESREYPRRVEIPVGFALARLHVLGGIAAWGHPFTQERGPACKLTWVHADGGTEERVFTDGAEFADWIGRREVPGSEWVDLLAEDSWGQVRTFSVAPERADAVVGSIVLESFDNHLAPTFLALTAELARPPGGGERASDGDLGLERAGTRGETAAAPSREENMRSILIFGGGSSHDFPRWFGEADGGLLAGRGHSVTYSEKSEELARALEVLEVLVLCNNQPLVDGAVRRGLFDFVRRGGGLVLVHPATWYNWVDWPEYNRELVGGGARSHEEYREFSVRVRAPEHGLMAGVPAEFTITDELYRLGLEPSAKSEVLAVGISLATGAEYPVVWTRTFGEGRIVGLTLGHDGAAHEHPAYRKLLENACAWAGG